MQRFFQANLVSGASTYQIRVNGDTDIESDETVIISLSRSPSTPDNLVIDLGSITFTIQNDDFPPLVDFNPGVISLTEDGTASYTVVLNTPPDNNVQIAVTPADPLVATVSPMTLTFAPINWSTAQTVTVTGADDDIVSSSESTMVDIRHTVDVGDGGSYTSALMIDAVSATVTDDDEAGLFIFETAITSIRAIPVTIDELTSLIFTVALTSEPTANVTLGTAGFLGDELTLDIDPGLTFTPGNWDTAQTVTLTALDDDNMENENREIFFTIGGASEYAMLNFLIGMRITINDDDMADVTITQTAGGTEVVESDGTDTYTVALDTEPMADVTIMADAGAGVTVDNGEGGNTLTFTSMDWDTAQTITVTGVNNDRDTADREVTIGHTATSGGSIYGGLLSGNVVVTVQDDDPTVVTLIRTGTGAIDEGGTVSFTVSLGRVLVAGEIIDVPLQVAGEVDRTDWSLALQSGAANTGITLHNETTPIPVVRFAEGSRIATLELTAVADGVTEDVMEMLIMVLGPDDDTAAGFDLGTRQTNVGGGADPASPPNEHFPLTINDVVVTLPEVTIAGGAAVTEGSDDAATFTLTAVPAPSADLTVTVAVAEEAGQGQDFVDAGVEGTGWPVTIGTSGTAEYTVAITDDDVDESNGTITVTIEAGSEHTVGDPGTATVVVNDDDVASVTVTQSGGDTEVAESGGTDSYTVVLTSEPAANVEITVTSDDTDISRVAPNNGAFTASTVLTFTSDNWNQVQTVRVQGVDDDIENASDRTVVIGHVISIPDADSGYPADRDIADVTVTVTDDDTAGLDISAGSSVTVDEEGTSTYTVALTSEPTADVTVTITGASEPLTVDTGTTLTFNDANWSEMQTVTLTAADDANMEEETFTLEHTASGSATEYGSVSEDVTVRVIDNDSSPPEVTIAGGAAVMEGDGNAATFTLTAVPAPTADLTVTVAVAEEAGQDFVDAGAEGTGRSVTIGTSGTAEYTVAITDDDVDESNGTITVTIEAGSDHTVGDPGTATVVVNDDDVASVTVTQSGGDTVVAESGGTDSYTVVLTSEPAANVEITVTSDDMDISRVAPNNGAFAASTVLTFTATNWNQAQTVRVQGVDDDIENASDRTVVIGHAISVPDADSGYPADRDIADVTVTVTDDDTAGLDISAGSSVTVDEEGTSTYTVALTSQPTADVTVTITGASDPLTVDTGTTLTFGNSNWSDVQTVTLTAADDADRDGETFTLEHRASGATEYGSVSEDVTVSVIDNDAVVQTAGVTVSTDSLEMLENAPRNRYTVRLNSEPDSDVVITVTSEAPSVFRLGTSGTITLTFSTENWSQAQQVTVADVNDNIDNLNDMRTGSITHVITTGDGGDYDDTLGIDPVSVTVLDDDIPLILITADSSSVEEGDTATFTISFVGIPEQSEKRLTISLMVTENTGGNRNVVPSAAEGDQTVVIPPNTGSVTYTIRTQSDRSSLDGQITVAGVLAPGTDLVNNFLGTSYFLDGGGSASVDVTDDGSVTAGLSISETAVTVDEEGTSTYTVALTSQPTADVTVTITGASDPLTVDTGAGTTLTFDDSNWSDVQTVTLTAADDADRDDETFTLEHRASGSATEYGSVSEDVTVTVNDDDTAGLSISETSVTVDEEGTSTYTVALTSQPTANVTVTISGASEPLTVDTGTGATLTFDDSNWSDVQTVTLTAADDADRDGETFTLVHTASGSATEYDSVSENVTVSVIDNDSTLPVVTIAGGAAVTEGSGNAATFTLTAVPAPTADLTVTVEVAEEAGQGQDFVDAGVEGTGRSVTIGTSGTAEYTVAITDDDVDESNGTITVTIEAGSDYTVGDPGTATVVVNDDDVAGLDISAGSSVTVDEEGTSTYTVALTSEPTADVTVTITGASAPLTVDTGATLTFDGSNWSDVQTVTLTAADDGNMDDETFTLEHTASGSATEYGSVSEDVTVRVIDNTAVAQTAGVTVSTDSLRILENDQNTYTVELDSQPDSAVVITVTSGAPSVFGLGTGADTGGTITLTFSTENWSQAQQVTVVSVNDNIDNLDDMRTGTITHVIATGDGDGGDYDDTLGIDPVSVTVVDEDVPTIRITADSSSVEEGDTATFIISLTSQSEKRLTISLTVSENTSNSRNVVPPAAEGDQTVEIPPNTGSVTYTIRTQSDRSPLDGQITVEVVLASGTDFGTTSYFGIGGNASVDVTDDGSFRATLSIDASLQGSSDTGNAFTVTEGDLGIRTVGTFTVRLSRSWPVNVSYSACHTGTAEIGLTSDAHIRNQFNVLQNLNSRGCYDGVILSGVQSFTLMVSVVGDRVFEPDETVHLELRTSAPNIDIDPTAGSITFTIQNDDPLAAGVTVTESDDDTTVDESGGTDSYTVVLTLEPTADVTITAAAGAGVTVDNGEGGNTLTFTSMDWDTARTITVTGVNDDSDTADLEVSIGHTVTSGDSTYSVLRPDDVVVTVTDDDPTVVNLTRTGGTGAIEEGGTVNFSITLSRALVAGETIDVPLLIAGTDVMPADWTLALLSGAVNTGVTLSGETTMMPTVSFSGDGAETAELQLTAVSDSDIEGSEMIVIALGNDTAFDDGALATNVDGGADPVAPPNEHFSLMINDVVVTLPEVTIAGGAAVMEGSGNAATFTLTAVPVPTADLTVTVAVAEEAGQGQDFVDAGAEGAGRLVTIGTSGTAEYTVAITDDDVDESNGTITVTIEAGSDYTVGDPGTATVVVNDDDVAGLDISAGSSVTVDEEGTSTYTVALTSQPTADVTVTITGASAPLTVDPGTTLTFDDSNWSEMQTVTLTAADDDNMDDETFTLEHRASGSATEYDSVSEDVTVRVIDNDSTLPVVSVTATQASEEESAGTLTFTVSIDGVLLSDLNVMLELVGTGTAQGASNAQGLGAVTVTIVAGATEATHLVVLVDDDTVEADGTVAATLQPATGYRIESSESTAEIAVTDDDEVQLSLSSATYTVDEGDAAPVTVQLTGRSMLAVPVRLILSDDTAVAGSDYPGTPIDATIAVSADSVSINVPTTEDAVSELSERFSVTIDEASLPDYVTRSAPFTATVTITDDDEAGVTVDSTTIEVSESTDEAGYTVVLDTEPLGRVEVTVTSTDETVAVVTSASPLIFTTDNWSTAQRVTVAVVDDDRDNAGGMRTATVEHAISADDGGSYTSAVDIDSVTVTVTDDDEGGVMIAQSAGNTVVAELGGMDSYTVVLSSEPAGNIVISVTSGEVTAATAEPMVLTFTTVTWNVAQTVTVTGVNDDIGNEGGQRIVTVSHAVTTGDAGSGYPAVLSIDAVSVTVMDDDEAGVTIAQTGAGTSVAELGGTDSYTVVLNAEPTGDVVIDVTSGEVTAATVEPTALTFTTATWDEAQEVTVTGEDDDIDNAGDGRVVSISHAVRAGSGGYDAVLIAAVSVSVEDDDEASLFLPDVVRVDEASEQSYEVSLGTQPISNVTVTISGSGGATGLTLDDDALTFTAGNWNDPQEVTVSAAPDDDMDNEVVTLMHRASAGYGAPATGQVEVRVTDDDIVRPGVQVSPTQVTVDENGGVSGYDVVLRTRPLGDVEIELSVSGAASAADVGPLSLSFTSTDWNVVQRVRVTGVNDDIDSADRMLDIGHTITTNDGGSYTGSLAIDSVSVRVEDDDEAGAHVNPGIVTVNESAGMDSYTVVLTSQPLGNSTVTIGLASRDSTAALVRPASLSFTSMNWDEAVRVTVTGVNDEVDNAGDVRVLDIVHAVTAGDGVGYRAGATVLPAATVIVEDDGDDAGLLLDVDERNADGTLSLIEQGDSRNYRVRLSSQPLSDVTVTITGAGSSLRVDAGGAGNSLTFTTMNWSEVQTVTLTAVDDGNLSGERVTLLHAASGGGYDGVTGELTVLIADNDRMSGVSIDSDALRVDEAGDMAIYTVVLDAQPSGDVEIGVSSDMTSAATVEPAVLRFTTANWNLRQRVTVTGEDDDIDNAGDGRMALITHRVRLSDGAGYPVDLAIDDVMVSVMDDDEAGLMFEPERVFIAEEGDSRNYRVSLSSQPTGDVSVTVNGAVGGLSVDTGGMPVNSLTFSRMNWRVAQNVMVRAFDDGNEVTETVTLTHTAVGGDYDSVTGRVDVVIADNDRAAGVSVDETVVRVSEGEAVIYTVVLDSEPRSDVEIRVTSSDSRIASVSPLTALTFTSDNWNEPQEVRVSGIDDAIDRADRMVSVDHAVSTGDSGGYNAGLSIESVSVTVLDDDERGLVLNRSTLGVIEDGASVAYTVSLSSQPTGDVSVTVNGAVGVLSVDTGGMPVNSLTFSSMNWRVAQNVMVRAFDDGNEVTETVTLTHTAVGGDYDLMMAQSLMVRIADDESMMAGVSVSERRVTVEESGGTATYRIHLDSPPMGNVVVSVLSTDMQAATVEPLSVGFTPLNWGEEQLVTVTGVDDDVDNGAFRTVRIEHRIVAGDGVGYRTGLSIESLEVRVTDDEGRSAGDIADEEQAQMQAAQEAWLSRFGLTAVEHMLGGLDYRFSSSRRAGLSGNVKGLPNGSAGQALSGEGVGSVRSLGVDGFGHGRAVGVGSGHDGFGAGSVDRLFKLSRSLSLPNMLRGSRFTYTDEGGTSVWGQASYSSYAGSPGEVSLKGDVTTAMLGMDRELGRTLLGLALAYSDGDGDWDDAGSGEFSSKLTSLLPYVRYDVTERLRFWGAASYGQGELEQTSSSGSVSTHDLEQVSASAGLRGTLMQSALEEGGLTLTLISEATLVRTETDDSARMAGMETDTHRFRMGLEWSWQSAETNGIRFTPELELGVRYDGGDTDTGLGIELGGGVNWEAPLKGLTLDLRGRRLLEHEDSERDEWGISGSLRFKLRPGSSHGPSLSLSQEYGNTTASSGLDRLLSGSLSDALEEDTSRAGKVSSRWTLKGEWGFALDSGATGVPYAGLSSSGDKRDLTLGWRLSSPGDDLDTKLDVRAMRREKEDGDANHSIGAELKVNW